jgi:hypothetical protein
MRAAMQLTSAGRVDSVVQTLSAARDTPSDSGTPSDSPLHDIVAHATNNNPRTAVTIACAAPDVFIEGASCRARSLPGTFPPLTAKRYERT